MIKEALIKKLQGEIEVARADLLTFLEKPIGVAEHKTMSLPLKRNLRHLLTHRRNLNF